MVRLVNNEWRMMRQEVIVTELKVALYPTIRLRTVN